MSEGSDFFKYNQGVYNFDYYSGAQVSLYIGDIWIDEVTSLAFQVEQQRRPLYGYGDQLFRDVTKGQVLVQGTFTINFKEAGYLYLVLTRYKQQLGLLNNPFGNVESNTKDFVLKDTIEAIVNNDEEEMTGFDRLVALQNLSSYLTTGKINETDTGEIRNLTSSSLRGYSETTRSKRKIGLAEDAFETFENAVWGFSSEKLANENRRADQVDLNPFDIYVAYGDFQGDDTVNHTIQKLVDVHIVGTSKQIVIDGQPIQEAYSFIAKNLV